MLCIAVALFFSSMALGDETHPSTDAAGTEDSVYIASTVYPNFELVSVSPGGAHRIIRGGPGTQETLLVLSNKPFAAANTTSTERLGAIQKNFPPSALHLFLDIETFELTPIGEFDSEFHGTPVCLYVAQIHAAEGEFVEVEPTEQDQAFALTTAPEDWAEEEKIAACGSVMKACLPASRESYPL